MADVKVIRFGRVEIGAIQQVENLGAKLEREALADCGRVLKVEKSHVARPGPMKRVPPEISVEPAVVRRRMKRVRIEPLRRIAEDDGAREAGLTNGRTGLRVSPLFDGL